MCKLSVGDDEVLFLRGLSFSARNWKSLSCNLLDRSFCERLRWPKQRGPFRGKHCNLKQTLCTAICRRECCSSFICVD